VFPKLGREPHCKGRRVARGPRAVFSSQLLCTSGGIYQSTPLKYLPNLIIHIYPSTEDILFTAVETASLYDQIIFQSPMRLYVQIRTLQNNSEKRPTAMRRFQAHSPAPNGQHTGAVRYLFRAGGDLRWSRRHRHRHPQTEQEKRENNCNVRAQFKAPSNSV
jgi:hypothetical protein